MCILLFKCPRRVTERIAIREEPRPTNKTRYNPFPRPRKSQEGTSPISLPQKDNKSVETPERKELASREEGGVGNDKKEQDGKAQEGEKNVETTPCCQCAHEDKKSSNEMELKDMISGDDKQEQKEKEEKEQDGEKKFVTQNTEDETKDEKEKAVGEIPQKGEIIVVNQSTNRFLALLG